MDVAGGCGTMVDGVTLNGETKRVDRCMHKYWKVENTAHTL